MTLSRRRFTHMVAALTAATAWSRPGFGLSQGKPNLGLNTWSLRALSQDEAVPIIIQVMKTAGLQDCELLFSHVEPTKLSPLFPVGLLSAPRFSPTPQQAEEERKTAAALTEWRMSVPMSYFENIRSQFDKQGLRIKSYAARLGNTEAEIDRIFLMASSLGVDSLNARVPESLTAIVAAAADKHRMMVGLQFSDIKMLERQLAASHFFRIDADIGDMTKAEIDPLKFVRTNYRSMSSMDLKDALKGGISVVFGKGDAQMKEVLLFLKEKHVGFTTYVDCDYAGTGRSSEEIERCVSYVRGIIG